MQQQHSPAGIERQLKESQQTLLELQQQDHKLTTDLARLKRNQEHKLVTEKTQPEDNTKTYRQLEKELENAMVRLKQVQVQLRQEIRKGNRDEVGSVDQLVEIESTIRTKDQDIKKVTQEVKHLSTLKRKQEKQLLNRDSHIQSQSQKASRLTDEVRGLRETLTKMDELVTKRNEDLNRKKVLVMELEEKYMESCRKTGEKPMSFEQFKATKRDKLKKQAESERIPKKKPYVSIKELVKSKNAYDNIQPTKQNLIELKAKREIAQAALKNARKKHESEIRDLGERLQGLKTENSTLKTRLTDKQREKKTIESQMFEGRRNNQRMTPLLDK